MTIFIDAMGGDNAPVEIIKGACLAVKEFDVAVTLIGDKDVIQNVFIKENLSQQNISILDAKETVTMQEEPAAAVRKKKDSSMVVGALKIKEDPSSVFISAGSTGALLAASLFYTGRIKGIQRPALGVLLPGKKPVLLIDNGANAECKAEYLVQFAKMGTAYMQAVMGIDAPRVGLINIGTEEIKGTPLYKEAHFLLKESGINFTGNIEPKELLNGAADIAVCDGFTGNIILKTLEGSFKYVLSLVKEVFMAKPFNKIAALIIKKDLSSKKDSMDPAAYGGVPLLGINGGIIKAHGSSNAIAIKNAVRQAVLFQKNNVLEKIIKML